MASNEQLQLQRPQEQQFDDQFADSNSELTCYESTLNCCGFFWGTLRAWCPCICCMCPYPYFQVTQGTKGLLQKFGKFQRVLEPGFHQINPFTERVLLVGNKTNVIDLERQIILTKDNITTSIDTVVYYRIYDAPKSQYRVKQIEQSVMEITYATLRTICGEHTLQDILEKRQQIADEIENFVFDTVKEWGVYMEQIFIKDMVLSPQLSEDLSLTSKTKRIAESKLISARADVEVAKLLREASDMLQSKAAMQIRYFETISQIAQGGNEKILFLPLNQLNEKKQ